MATVDLSIIERVLPEVPKVSEAPSDVDLDARRYKAIDTRTGDIYLVGNPHCWITFIDDKGRTWKRRPAIEIALTYSEAQSAATFTTASTRKSGRRSMWGEEAL